MLGLISDESSTTNPFQENIRTRDASPKMNKAFLEDLVDVNQQELQYEFESIQLDSIIPNSTHDQIEHIELETLKEKRISFPSKFKNYTFDRILGKGGFSSVIKVVNNDTGEFYAAKIMPLDEICDNNEFKYAKNEIKYLKKIDHENVIKYYDSFNVVNNENTEYFVIITEFCQNGSLLDAVNKLPKKKLNEILFKIAKTVDYLHDKGIAHCDIKLDNILLDSNLNPKLCDFGFAKSCKKVPDNQKCYTLVYAAPEILKKGSYDPFLADIWALGITFYSADAKTFPFLEELSFETQILKGKFYFKPESDIQKLALKCLKKNPNKRITMKEMIQDDCFKVT